MWLAVLGAMEAAVDGAPVDLGTRKQRALLAAIALHRGRPVSPDSLIDLVWGDDPPASVTNTLHAYISGLRRVLEPNRPPRAPSTVLVTQAPGYALRLTPDELDVEHFEQAVAAAHTALGPLTASGVGSADLAPGDLADLTRALDEALALWRGTPYLELEDAHAAVAERARLEELRVIALEDRAAARLALGQHAVVAGELEALTSAHPLRERLWALRALALTRSGRQADALDVLGQVRTLLDEELGLEPGAELRELQTAILRQDPALAWAPGSARGDAGGVATTVAAPVAAVGPVEHPPLPPDDEPAWPMVGRDAELADLVDALDAAADGTPRLAALVGEPGIGKSRLASELVRAARGRGVTVAVGRCSQDDGAPPLWPWTAAFASLGRTLPELPATDDEGARFRTWDAIARAVTEAAQDRPLLLVLDDLHWADVTSLRVLRLLAETARPARLMVLGTWRVNPEPEGALADLAETFARRHAVRVHLGGLTADEVATVVEAVAHDEPSVDQAAALRARTDGNPFFLVEYARLAATRGGDLDALLREPDPPAAVTDVLLRRVRRLPDSTQRLLGTASAIGRTFDLDTLSASAGVDADDVLDDLDPALAAGLLQVVGPEQLRFAHALVRDTVYAGLGPRQPRTHARVATALASAPRTPASELARQWALAGPAYVAQVRAASVAAAEEARRVHAYDEAEQHLAVALAALDDDPAATARERYDLLLQLGDAHRWAGRWDGLIRCIEDAIVVAEELDDIALVAQAAIGATVGALWQSAAHGETHAGVVAALRRSLDELPAEDSALRCRVMLSLANEIYYGSTNQERDALTEQALAMAHRLDDKPLLLDAYLTSFMTTWRASTVEARHGYTTAALELARQLGDRRSEAVASVLLVVSAHERGAVAEMWERERTARALCEELRLPYGLLVLDTLILPWHAMAGRFEECDRILDSILALDQQMSLRQYDDAAAGVKLSLALWRGQAAETLPVLLHLEEESPLPVTPCVAMFMARAGMVEEARQHLATHPVDLDHDDWFSFFTWGCAAEASLTVGGPALAADAYARLAPHAGRPCTAGSSMATGPVDGFLAMAAAATGERALATEHIERALALCAEWDTPLVADWLNHLRSTYDF